MSGWRLHRFRAAGDEFLVGFAAALPDAAMLAEGAARACRSAAGVEGLLLAVLRIPQDGAAAAKARLWDRDGAVAALPPAALMCLAHAAVHATAAAEIEIAVRTDIGAARCAARAGDEPSAAQAQTRVSAPAQGPLPDLEASSPPAAAACGVMRWNTLDTGEPHIVLEVPDIETVDADKAGPAVSALFSGGVNAHFMAERSGRVEMRSWRHAAARAAACVSGAAAVTAALSQWGRADGGATVHTSEGPVSVTPDHGWRLEAESLLLQADVAVLGDGRNNTSSALFDAAPFDNSMFDGAMFPAAVSST